VATSILDSVKKVLGMDASYTVFDEDVLMHINSAFSTLNQLGIGPQNGLMIEDDSATWDSLIGTDPRLNWAKSYTYLKVRQLFDPPGTAYLVDAMEKQIRELEWRMNTYREETAWVSPIEEPLPEEVILDGGEP
jgi:hypothetical protein